MMLTYGHRLRDPVPEKGAAVLGYGPHLARGADAHRLKLRVRVHLSPTGTLRTAGTNALKEKE